MNPRTWNGLNVVLVICSHGTHSNGIGQGPSGDIEVVNWFMKNKN
jgi:hypothetical protein